MEEEEKQQQPRYRADGREIVQWPKFGAYDFVNPYGLCVMRPKRPKTPDYDKPRQGCAILEPKVNEPYEAIPRRATRKELLKKIREIFNTSDIESILKNNHNIDFSIPDQNKLNISFFDDKIYEIYPNEYWLNKAIDKHTGRQLKLLAKALIFDKETRTGTWKRVLISEYNKESDTFNGQIDDENKTEFKNMPKLFILFDAENPFVFAKRLAEAIRLRNESESIIKYKIKPDVF